MASLHREIEVDVPADAAWRAVADVGATDKLFPGVLVACRLEDGARVVTFANGLVARELIVDVDAARRRLAYAVVGSERLTHHHATFTVEPTGAGTCRIDWDADFLPDAMRQVISGLMDLGAAAMPRGLRAAVENA
jgi:carbon monoxide dehydrogenase subunit G